ncbi:hypothetical protein D3C71_1341360 [compost metagenome]
MELLRLRVPHDGKQVTADAIAGGLHQAQRGVGRDRRVHRRAAALHHVQRDLGGQWLGGGGHRMRGDHLRAGGEGMAGDAIGGDAGDGKGTQHGGGKQAAGKSSGHGVVPDGW